jgi:hypothetical protein
MLVREPPSTISVRCPGESRLNPCNLLFNAYDITDVRKPKAPSLKPRRKLGLGAFVRAVVSSEAASELDFELAADEVERVLGLEGQPRAIVFHEKEGRRHAHVVWSRIDARAMRADSTSGRITTPRVHARQHGAELHKEAKPTRKRAGLIGPRCPSLFHDRSRDWFAGLIDQGNLSTTTQRRPCLVSGSSMMRPP